MNFLKYSICDDDSSFRSVLQQTAESTFSLSGIRTLVSEFSSAEDFLKSSELLSFSLIFLDIDMPGMNGIEFAERLRSIGCASDIIYVSNMDSKVYEIFHVHPWSFIRKSHIAEDLPPVIKEYIQTIKTRSNSFMLTNTNGLIRNFGPEDVLYVESAGKEQQVFLSDSSLFLVRDSLHNLEEQLVPFGFIRIHKGFLVNFRYIKKITSRYVILDTGKELPIGRNNLKVTRETYLSLMKWRGVHC